VVTSLLPWRKRRPRAAGTVLAEAVVVPRLNPSKGVPSQHADGAERPRKGAGSLRDAIGHAHNGDTVVFAPALAAKRFMLTSGGCPIKKVWTSKGRAPACWPSSA